MTSWGKDNRPHLTASKLCEANHTGVRLAHVSMGSDTGPGQPVTHKMLTFPTLFSLSPSTLRIYSSLKYVCTVCKCMYVQNLTIGLEHINQKRWAIPHCVLQSYIISASWVRRDEPSLFIWSILWEHGEAVRGQQPQLLLKLTLQVGLMLNICHPFCSCDRNTAATVMMTFNCGLADNTLHCIVRPL